MKVTNKTVMVLILAATAGVILALLTGAWLYFEGASASGGRSVAAMVWLTVVVITSCSANLFYKYISKNGRARIICAMAFYAYAAVVAHASVDNVFIIGILMVSFGMKALVGTDPNGVLDSPVVDYGVIAAGFLCMFMATTFAETVVSSWQVSTVAYLLGALLSASVLIPAARTDINSVDSAT